MTNIKEQRTITPIKVFSLLIVIIYAMYYYFTRGYIANVKEFLPVTATEFSKISSAFSIAYGLSQPIGGFAMDKIGIKYLCPALLLIACGATYIFAAHTDISVAIYSRYILGTCMCVASTGGFKYISLVWTKDFNILSNILPILMSLSAMLASSAFVANIMRNIGWRNFLKIYAVVGVGLAVLLYICLMAVFSKKDEKNEEVKDTKPVSLLEGIKEIISLPGFFPVTLYTIAISAAAYLLMDGWGNTLLSMKFPALPLSSLSAPATVNNLGTAMGFVYNIWASSKISIKKQMAVYAVIGLVALGLILYVDISFNVFLLCCFLLGYTCAAQNIGFMWLQSNLSSKYLGLAFGLLNFACMFFGCALVQKLAGNILDSIKNTALASGVPFYNGYRYGDLIEMFQYLFIPGIIALLIIFLVKNQSSKQR
jgi:MFS family permease